MAIEPYQLPEANFCCTTDSGSSSGGGGSDSDGGSDSGREWILFGEVHPEGNVVALRRTIYRRRNAEYYEFYMKDSGDDTAFGWTLYHQVAAPVV